MSHKKLFGTDGVRRTTRRNDPDALTPEIMYRLARATVDVLNPSQRVIVGRDTRPSGVRLSRAALLGAIDAGAHTIDLGIAPTPLVGWATAHVPESIGIVVTASHNPVEDNGFKVLLQNGKKADEAQQGAIEEVFWREISQPVSLEGPDLTVEDEDMSAHYIKCVVDTLYERYGELPLQNKFFVLDTAHGAAKGVTQQIFSMLGAHTVTIDRSKDGVINRGCGANDLSAVLRYLELHHAEFDNIDFVGALANDGDGDRVMGATIVDGTPVTINGNHFMYYLSSEQPGIVGTDYTNSGLVTRLNSDGIDFEYCENGDRFVTERLLAKQAMGELWKRGGEFTGHLIDTDHLKSGDGVYMAAWFACEVVARGNTFADIYRELPLWHEQIENIRLEPQQLQVIDDPTLIEYIEAMKDKLSGDARIHVRASGTEPLIRVWCESPDQARVEQSIAQLGSMVRLLAQATN